MEEDMQEVLHMLLLFAAELPHASPAHAAVAAMTLCTVTSPAGCSLKWSDPLNG
jgi:hypothetical protein